MEEVGVVHARALEGGTQDVAAFQGFVWIFLQWYLYTDETYIIFETLYRQNFIVKILLICLI